MPRPPLHSTPLVVASTRRRRVSGGRSGNRPAEATLHLETLEQRLPLAVSTCSLDALSGILAIRCDDTNSRVDLRVTQTGQGVTAIVRLQVLENGRTVRGQFPLSQVRKIEFTGGIRDDLFNAAAVSLRVQAVGNDGNDTLVGGRGANTLDGGNGRDTLRAVGSSVMYGQDGDDTITTGDSDDVIEGGDGNDRITSGGGRDTIYAGRGNDQVNAGSGEDEIHGEDGNDGLTGGDSNDRIAGGAGVDVIFGGNGDDTLSGGNDGDIIQGDAGADTINGEAGNDLLAGGEGDDAISGGTGTDTINGDAGGDRLFGGDDADTIRGGIGNDFINGESGHDVIYGDADNDSILGGTGNDRIDGGFGSDTINGESDLDALSGGDGNDILLGGTGNDTLQGNAGNDTVVGEDGDDTIDGGSGNDTLRGNAGNDTVNGGPNVDQIFGGIGDDRLDGGEHNDTIDGDAGNDHLLGGPGDDLLRGGDDDDTVNGNAGSDRLFGNDGDDTLVSLDDLYGDRLQGDAGRDGFWYDSTGADGTGSADVRVDLGALDANNFVRPANFVAPGTGQPLGFAFRAIGGRRSGMDRTLDGDRIINPGLTGLSYRSFAGNPLFPAAGPSGTDIDQGAVGDCMILASFSALAHNSLAGDGWSIRRSIADFGDGTYGVALANNFRLRLNADLPVDANGELVFARLGVENALWVPLLEKAIVYFSNWASTYGIANVAPNTPLNYASLDFDPRFPAQMFTFFGSTTTGTTICTSFANSTQLGNDLFNRWNSYQNVTVAIDDFNINLGLPVDHAYTLWQVNRDANDVVTSIVLRNPWGEDGGTTYGGRVAAYQDGNPNDALITLSAAQLFATTPGVPQNGCYYWWGSAVI